MNNPEISQLIEQIRRKAEALEFSGDELEFDKRVAELDLLVYKLRSVAWTKPKVNAIMSDLDHVLKDLMGD